MKSIMLGCCKLYISESRNSSALEFIELSIKHLRPHTLIVNKFRDDAYNRVGYTVASPLPGSGLRKAVFEMVKAAFNRLNLEFHSGTHPRLGVIDHVCFHPLGKAVLEQAAEVARGVAADIGDRLQVPTFLYGAAHKDQRTLDSIRRELGYFKPNSSGTQWTGTPNYDNLQLNTDEGPSKIPQSKGVIVIGATHWVDNYNVPIMSTDMATVKRIARLVSGRGGGLQSVQAMALAHGEGVIEVACNLLEPNKVNADQVQFEVEQLAVKEGLVARKGYFTDHSREAIVEQYIKLSSS